MKPELPQEMRNFMERLDRAVPPHSDLIGSLGGDPLVEAAQRIALLPTVHLPETAVDRIEARLRAYTLQLGMTKPHPPKPWGRYLAVTTLVIVLVVSGLVYFSQGEEPALPPGPVAPTLTETPEATVSPTPTLIVSASPEPSPSPGESAPPVIATTPTPTPTTTLSPTPTLAPLPEPSVTPLAVGTIVIEGPVESIHADLIVIYGFEIRLNPADPVSTSLRVGDHLRVESDIVTTETGVVLLVARTVVFVDVTLYISPSGEVFRDDEDCSHPPPDWAPAHGWRARCEGEDKDKGNGEDNDSDD